MNIAIDILHISYWNFYKNIIDMLENNGHSVYLFVRKRGPLLNVIRKEYANQEKCHHYWNILQRKKKNFTPYVKGPYINISYHEV